MKKRQVDPAEMNTSPQDMLSNVLGYLKSCKPSLEGTTYDYSTTNSLPADWLIQSAPTDTSCSLLKSIQQSFDTEVQQKPAAQHYIDILHLGNDRANDAFQLQMIDSIVKFANTAKNSITIRYIEGNQASTGANSAKYFYFFSELMKKYTGTSDVTIYAASFDYPWVGVDTQYDFGSWNHAKIIAIDGNVSIVGGQNYWNDYLGVYSRSIDPLVLAS